MSLDKPWEKPFERLLQEFSLQYKGKISKSESNGKRPLWGYDSSFFFYPLFYGEWKDQTFTIEISEFSASMFGDFEAVDNVEYLRIFVIRRSSYNIMIVHEDWHHRFAKKLHLDREFQTGSKEFDYKYYLRTQSDKDKCLVANLRLQDMVRSLEPFSAIQILKPGILWSQMLTDEKQLEFWVVDNYLKKTLELTKLIPAI
jgi:hypothetical protein